MKSLLRILSLAILAISTYEFHSTNLHVGAVTLQDKDTCYALVLTGGGIKGAWQIAAMKGMVDKANSIGKSFNYDVLSGVSAGAINSFGGYYTNNDADWVYELYDIWKNLEMGDASSACSHGIFHWLWHTLMRRGPVVSVCDNEPLRQLFIDYIKRHGKTIRKATIATATRLEDAAFVAFDEKSGIDGMLKAILGSSAVPGLFPPEKIDGKNYVDGGLLLNSNTEVAIQKCIELRRAIAPCDEKCVEEDFNIIIDFIAPNAWLGVFNSNDMNIISIATRSFELLIDKTGGFYPFFNILRKYKSVKYRYTLAPKPEEILQFPDTFDFRTGGKRDLMMNLGYKTGFNANKASKAYEDTNIPDDLKPQRAPAHFDVI